MWTLAIKDIFKNWFFQKKKIGFFYCDGNFVSFFCF